MPWPPRDRRLGRGGGQLRSDGQFPPGALPGQSASSRGQGGTPGPTPPPHGPSSGFFPGGSRRAAPGRGAFVPARERLQDDVLYGAPWSKRKKSTAISASWFDRAGSARTLGRARSAEEAPAGGLRDGEGQAAGRPTRRDGPQHPLVISLGGPRSGPLPPDRIRREGRLSASDTVISIDPDDNAAWQKIKEELKPRLGSRWERVSELLRPMFDSAAVKPNLTVLARGEEKDVPIIKESTHEGSLVVDAVVVGDLFVHKADGKGVEFEDGSESQAGTGTFHQKRWRWYTGPYVKVDDGEDLQYTTTPSRYWDTVDQRGTEDTGRVVNKSKTVEPGAIFKGMLQLGVRIRSADGTHDEERYPVDLPVEVEVPAADCPDADGNPPPVTEHYAPPLRTRSGRLGSTDVVLDVYPRRTASGGRKRLRDLVDEIDDQGREVFGAAWPKVKGHIQSQLPLGKVHQRLKGMTAGQPIAIHLGSLPGSVEVTAQIVRMKHVRGTKQTEFNTGTEIVRRGAIVSTLSKAWQLIPLPGQFLIEAAKPFLAAGGITTELRGRDTTRAKYAVSRTGMATKEKAPGEIFESVVQLRFEMHNEPLVGDERATVAVVDDRVGAEVLIERAEAVRVDSHAATIWDARSPPGDGAAPGKPPAEILVPPERVWSAQAGHGLKDTDVIRDLWNMKAVRKALDDNMKDLLGRRNWRKVRSPVLDTYSRDRFMANLPGMTRKTALDGPDMVQRGLPAGAAVEATASVTALAFHRKANVELAPQGDTGSLVTEQRFNWKTGRLVVQPVGGMPESGAVQVPMAFGGGLQRLIKLGWRRGFSGEAVTNAKFPVTVAVYRGMVELSFIGRAGGREVPFGVKVPFEVAIPAGETATLSAQGLSDWLEQAGDREPDPDTKEPYRLPATREHYEQLRPEHITKASGYLVAKPKAEETAQLAVPERVAGGRLGRSDFILSIDPDRNQLAADVTRVLEPLLGPGKGWRRSRRRIRNRLDSAAVKPRIPGMTSGDVVSVWVSGNGWSGWVRVTAVARDMTYKETSPKVEFENGTQEQSTAGAVEDGAHRKIANFQFKIKAPHTNISFSGGRDWEKATSLATYGGGKTIAKGKTVEPGAMLPGHIDFLVSYDLSRLGSSFKPGSGRVSMEVVAMVPERDMRRVPAAGTSAAETSAAAAPTGQLPAKEKEKEKEKEKDEEKRFASAKRIREQLVLSSSDILLDFFLPMPSPPTDPTPTDRTLVNPTTTSHTATNPTPTSRTSTGRTLSWGALSWRRSTGSTLVGRTPTSRTLSWGRLSWRRLSWRRSTGSTLVGRTPTDRTPTSRTSTGRTLSWGRPSWRRSTGSTLVGRTPTDRTLTGRTLTARTPTDPMSTTGPVTSAQPVSRRPAGLTELMTDPGMKEAGQDVFGWRVWRKMRAKFLDEVDLGQIFHGLRAMTAGHPIAVEAPRGIDGRILVTAYVSEASHVSNTKQTEFNTGTQLVRGVAAADNELTNDLAEGVGGTLQVLATTDPFGESGVAFQAGPTFTGAIGEDDREYVTSTTVAGVTTKTKVAGADFKGTVVLVFWLERKPRWLKTKPRWLKTKPRRGAERIRRHLASADVRWLSEQAESAPRSTQAETEFKFQPGQLCAYCGQLKSAAGRDAAGQPICEPCRQVLAPEPDPPHSDAPVAPPQRVWDTTPGRGLSDKDVIRGLPSMGGLYRAVQIEGRKFFGATDWKLIGSAAAAGFSQPQLAAALPGITRGPALLSPLAVSMLAGPNTQIAARARVLSMEYLRTDPNAETNPVNEISEQASQSYQYWWMEGAGATVGLEVGPVTADWTTGAMYRSRDATDQGTGGKVVSNTKGPAPAAIYNAQVLITFTFRNGDRTHEVKGVIPAEIGIQLDETDAAPAGTKEFSAPDTKLPGSPGAAPRDDPELKAYMSRLRNQVALHVPHGSITAQLQAIPGSDPATELSEPELRALAAYQQAGTLRIFEAPAQAGDRPREVKIAPARRDDALREVGAAADLGVLLRAGRSLAIKAAEGGRVGPVDLAVTRYDGLGAARVVHYVFDGRTDADSVGRSGLVHADGEAAYARVVRARQRRPRLVAVRAAAEDRFARARRALQAADSQEETAWIRLQGWGRTHGDPTQAESNGTVEEYEALTVELRDARLRASAARRELDEARRQRDAAAKADDENRAALLQDANAHYRSIILADRAGRQAIRTADDARTLALLRAGRGARTQHAVSWLVPPRERVLTYLRPASASGARGPGITRADHARQTVRDIHPGGRDGRPWIARMWVNRG